MSNMSTRLHDSMRTYKAAWPTFPTPEAFDVAEDLHLSLEAGEPKYKSFLRLTPGVASSVFFCDFWHLAQTILYLE